MLTFVNKRSSVFWRNCNFLFACIPPTVCLPAWANKQSTAVWESTGGILCSFNEFAMKSSHLKQLGATDHLLRYHPIFHVYSLIWQAEDFPRNTFHLHIVTTCNVSHILCVFMQFHIKFSFCFSADASPDLSSQAMQWKPTITSSIYSFISFSYLIRPSSVYALFRQARHLAPLWCCG